MSFTRKKVHVSFRLGGPTPANGNGNANTIATTGLRVSATISDVGGAQPTSSLRIYGLSLSWMNLLSTIGKPYGSVNANTVTVAAGDDENGMSTVFVGNIDMAYADLNEAPDSPLVVRAMAGAMSRMVIAPSQFYPGSADVASMLAGLANRMNWKFQNYGVTARLTDQQLEGTVMQQIEKIVQAANINATYDNSTITIWPMNGAKGGLIPVISKENGMIGTPSYFQYGITVETEFNPQITVGTNVEVKSIITPASGRWPVLRVEHRLDAEVPGGAWLTRADCGYPTVYNQGRP